MIGAISNALSGLVASTKKVEGVASNVANALTIGSLDPNSPNQPYQAIETVVTPTSAGGIVAQNLPKSPGVLNAYAPDSPFANERGEIGVPNVDLTEELVNLKRAELSYGANAAVIKTSSEMTDALLNVFDKKI